MNDDQNPEPVTTATRLPRAEFIGHALDDDALRALDRIRAAFSDLLDAVDRDVPASRERSIVVTSLQEACMWAVRGVAVNGAAQKA